MAFESDPLAERQTKLPFWKTIGRSYSVFFNNIGSAFRVTWLWLLVTGVVAGASCYAQMDALRVLFERTPSLGTAPALPSKFSVLALLPGALMLVGGASCAVMWHRFLLLAEKPGLSGSNVGSGRLWRYVWTGILILLIVALFALPLGGGVTYLIMQGQQHTKNPVVAGSVIGVVVLWLCGVLVIVRLAPLLPARAVGNDTVTFRQMWAATKGNSWRLFGGCIMTLIPPLALLQILFGHAILSKLAPTPGQAFHLSQDAMIEMIVFQTVGAVYGLFASLIMIGFLSFSYQYFFGGPNLAVPESRDAFGPR
jgi:hypothetical protein